MKFTEITFHQLFATGQYENQRLEAKATLEEGDTLCEAFKEAKKQIGEAFRFINPQPNFFDTTSEVINGKTNPLYQPPQPIQSIDYKAKEKLEIDIDNATTKADLEFYIEAAEKYGLMELWSNKLNELK